MMNPSIRKRLLLILLTATALVYGVSTAKTYVDSRRDITELLDAQLAQSAHALHALSMHELFEQMAYEAAMKQTSEGQTRKITPQVHKYEQPVAFQIWLGGEKLVVRSENAPPHPLSNIDDVFSDRIIDGQNWRVYSAWNNDHTIKVHVGELASVREHLADQIARQNITTYLLSLPLLALVIWQGVRHAMDPLNRLANDVAGREFDNLKSLDNDGVPLEAKPLVDALNGLFQRLRMAFDSVRSFTGNAAHELRTPLAALKTHAQVGRAQTDYQSAIAALDYVIDDVNRAIHLVEQMLTIARLDPESHLQKMEDIDLCSLAQDEMAIMGIPATEKDIQLDLQCTTSRLVRGKEALLGTLLRNLVGNAIRYINHGGQVQVRVGDDAEGGVILSVEDDGPGIPAQEREKVFDRFYRGVDTANKTNGSGLGLSIVRRIIELHEARISLGDSPLGGLQVQVRLQAGGKLTRKPMQEDIAVAN